MTGVRTYGKKPYTVALIHGGPGAPGSLAPIAEKLCADIGVLEPLQSADSVSGQVEELNNQLKDYNLPMVLLGHSWGAWLAILYAVVYPQHVSRLILIGCPPFEKSHAMRIMQNRLKRLEKSDRQAVIALIRKMNVEALTEAEMDRFNALMIKTDGYDAKKVKQNAAEIAFQPEVLNSVWSEATKMRERVEIKEAVMNISCPVMVIHGKQDPHPYKSILKTLKIKHPEIHLIDRCGHNPWEEKFADEVFYEVLIDKLRL